MTHDEWIEVADKVNAMSNWQRNQWARNGYRPGMLNYHASLQRWWLRSEAA